MSGTTNTGTGKGYFARNIVRTESDVLAKKVVMPKDKCGIPGSRKHVIHFSEATGALNPTFGAARNFVPKIQEGEPNNQHYNIK